MNVLEELKGAETVGITGHIRPDGDCIGSCMGLYSYLKDNCPQLDVTVYLETPGSEFHYIRDIDKIQTIPDIKKKYDVFFVLDCSSLDRIEPFHNCFENAKKTVCIDHHISNGSFADVNVVDAQASSACEVLYRTLEDDKISKDTAACIYTGIVHDTGVFKYSSTSAQTMLIAGKMMEKGGPVPLDILMKYNSFYAKTYIQNQILGRALLESVLFYDGKCIFSLVTQDEMNFYGVTGSQLGGIVEQLRLTEGVEVAIFLYQTGEEEYKVSLRSKKVIDVSKIAMHYGGGGHIRAAGFTANGAVHDIINNIGARIEEQYNALSGAENVE